MRGPNSSPSSPCGQSGRTPGFVSRVLQVGTLAPQRQDEAASLQRVHCIPIVTKERVNVNWGNLIPGCPILPTFLNDIMITLYQQHHGCIDKGWRMFGISRHLKWLSFSGRLSSRSSITLGNTSCRLIPGTFSSTAAWDVWQVLRLCSIKQ